VAVSKFRTWAPPSAAIIWRVAGQPLQEMTDCMQADSDAMLGDANGCRADTSAPAGSGGYIHEDPPWPLADHRGLS
jgi:hypothetical protein